METKHCYICKLNLPLESFCKNKSSYDGLASGCKKCRNIIKKIYRENSKDVIQKQRDNYNERLVEHNRNWEINHREERHNIQQRRRSKKRQLVSTLTIKQWDMIKKYFNNQCAYCGEELPLEQEHFLALTKCGEYTINNIICACKSCNSSKGNKDFFEWYPKYRYYSKKRENTILKFLNYKGKNQQLTLAI